MFIAVLSYLRSHITLQLFYYYFYIIYPYLFHLLPFYQHVGTVLSSFITFYHLSVFYDRFIAVLSSGLSMFYYHFYLYHFSLSFIGVLVSLHHCFIITSYHLLVFYDSFIITLSFIILIFNVITCWGLHPHVTELVTIVIMLFKVCFLMSRPLSHLFVTFHTMEKVFIFRSS